MYDSTKTNEPGNQIASFSFKNMQVRIVIKDGEPWFAAHDVAVALEYRDAEGLTRLLKEDEKGPYKTGTHGGEQSLLFINEKGLYRGIFNSRKPEALAFQDWVVGEVLPAIRKQGYYGQSPSTEKPAIDQGLVYSQPLCLLIQPQACVTCVMPDGLLQTFGWPDRDLHHHLVVGDPLALNSIMENRAPIPHYTLFGAPLWFDLLGRRAMIAVGDAHTPTSKDLRPLPAARSLIIGREFEMHNLYEHMGYSVARYLVPRETAADRHEIA